MSYRGPNPERMSAQAGDVFQHAGQVVTWRRFVSANSGIPGVGLGGENFYAERTITALFADANQLESQTPAGLIAAGELVMTTREKIGRSDELVWRGIEYRVDSDPMPARFDGWTTVIRRGNA